MPYLIDPPSAWDAPEAWRAYLADLEGELADNPDDPDLVQAIREAKAHIAEAEGNQT